MNDYSESSGLFEAIGTVGVIIYLAFLVLMIAAWWKIFTKAGKPGWAAIIPIYNMIVLCEIIGKPAWWFLLIWLLAPIFGIWALNLLSKSFGHGVGFTLGMLFLGFIFIPVLGFGGSTYQGPASSDAQG